MYLRTYSLDGIPLNPVDINGGTIDGTVIGGSAPAAGSFLALVATTGTFSGVLSVDDVTDTSSGVTGSIHTDGGLGVAKNIFCTGSVTVSNGFFTTGTSRFGSNTGGSNNGNILVTDSDTTPSLTWRSASVAKVTLGVDVTGTTLALTGSQSISGALGVGAAPSANADLLLEAGRLMLKESTTPTADANYGKVYTKTDNKLYFQDGAGVEHDVTGSSVSFKSYAIADLGNSGTHYAGGFYEAPAAHVVLTIGGAVTQTLGSAGEMKAAHAFCVASGAGGTDLVLTVTGISIASDGTRNDSDSEVIVADADAATTDQYFETTKKWLGQVTFTLTGAAGAFTFNYGFVKYEDFGNRDFTLTDFEMTLHGSANETGFDVQLLHHKATGWTYSAAAFEPGTGAVVSSLTDNSSTNDNFTSGDYAAYKRAGLTTAIMGNDGEGTIIRMITAVNNSVSHGTLHIGVTV